MTINLETLRAELHAEIEKLHDEIDRRCDAATQKKADVEPPMLTETMLDYLYKWGGSISTQRAAATRIRYVEAELARLREGLKERESDITGLELESWGDDNDFEYGLETMRAYIRSQCRSMAREIQRHRRLVQP